MGSVGVINRNQSLSVNGRVAHHGFERMGRIRTVQARKTVHKPGGRWRLHVENEGQFEYPYGRVYNVVMKYAD